MKNAKELLLEFNAFSFRDPQKAAASDRNSRPPLGPFGKVWSAAATRLSSREAFKSLTSHQRPLLCELCSWPFNPSFLGPFWLRERLWPERPLGLAIPFRLDGSLAALRGPA